MPINIEAINHAGLDMKKERILALNSPFLLSISILILLEEMNAISIPEKKAENESEIIVSNNFAAREACIPEVNLIIEQETSKFTKWVTERDSVPYITKFRSEVQSLVEKKFDGFLGKEISKVMALKIMNEVLHEPTQEISSTKTQLQTAPYADEIGKRLNT